MVRRPPARPSQLPDWYSSGVPAGPTLCRVDPLHLEGLRGGNSAYHTSLGGHSVGRHPLVTRFLQRLRPPARELMLCGGSGCYSIASSPLLSPFLGIKTHFSEVGLRDAGPSHFSHLWPFSLTLAVLHPH